MDERVYCIMLSQFAHYYPCLNSNYTSCLQLKALPRFTGWLQSIKSDGVACNAIQARSEQLGNLEPMMRQAMVMISRRRWCRWHCKAKDNWPRDEGRTNCLLVLGLTSSYFPGLRRCLWVRHHHHCWEGTEVEWWRLISQTIYADGAMHNEL